MWDGFTHRGGLFVSAIPLLQQELGPFPGFRWAQYASGVLGLLGLGIGAVVWYVDRRPRKLRSDGRQPVRIAAAAVVLAAAVVPAGIVLAGAGIDPLDAAYRAHVVRAAILLVGGGARGAVWQRTVARLSGRPVQVPDITELVAVGAAAQAAACLSGEAPEMVARRWDTRRGVTVDAPVERDVETLDRIRATREATLALHEG